MNLAVLFIFLNCIVLTFSRSVRLHAWAGEINWQHWIGFVVWIAGFSFFYRKVNKYLPDRDPYLLPIISLLSGWGLIDIYRLNPALGLRQTLWLAVSMMVLLIGIRLPKLLTWLRRYKYLWLTCGLGLMVLTLFMGVYPGGEGPGLWLEVFDLYIQPSEFLKLLLVIYLAAYLADNLPVHFHIVQLITPTLVVGLVSLAILVVQRDLGTASLLIVLYSLVIYVASGKRRVLLFSFLIMCLALAGGYLIFDVIKLRVEAWINPWLDPSGRSYQIVQSIMAVANGGLFGRGIGLGSPGVVPVAHSDFIFASIAEEFGIAGIIGICILLGILAVRGIAIALHAPNQYQRFLAVGLTSSLITQAGLIICGNLRILPLTGVTLPFVSYGGSSLLTSFFSALLLLLISNQAEDQPAAIERLRPYTFIGTVFLGGLFLVALVTGWWSLIQSNNLLSRSDNPRRAISDAYVIRGDIVDRNNQVLAQSSGESGSYVRLLNLPSLSSLVGYSNPDYGQTGIEKNLDDYLRGVKGNSPLTIWLARDLYGQYPTGLDVRLSLDATLQAKADQLLAGQKGALILMNAHTGEILASATAPTFDANQLDTKWEDWMKDSDAPLLNRVTQGQYPVGNATAVFLYASALSQDNLPDLPDIYTSGSQTLKSLCAVDPGDEPDWADLVASGCQHTTSALANVITPTRLWELYSKLGFFKQPDVPLELADATSLTYPIDPQMIEKNSISWHVSPLQMVIAASALTNEGKVPEPELAEAYLSPENEWIAFQKTEEGNTLSNFNAATSIENLVRSSFPGWETLSQIKENDVMINWYLAGTPQSWMATPLALVVVTENGTPEKTQEIGREMFLTAVNPYR